ncbi:MAG: hypothetical protein SOR94_05760 [Lawsonella sp.]|uniref:hypothetical protein n=1 Tax=Lawsonella sp. TaxID=2041415 RepID=UPI002A74872D|nr:hypothetical protein [Lawsonella sp.]MDY2979523.1 hypothetical protein [Lawsonella sp.]
MIKNIEAYHTVMDYLTQNETWKEEEVPGNLRDERLAHSSEATWVWGEDNTIETAATQLSEMEEHYGTCANFVTVEHDGTWLAVSTLEVSAMYISTIYQYMEREEEWWKERAYYADQIESLRKQLSTLKEKGL